MNKLPSSFRDPSGFIFRHNGRLLRQINHSAKQDFDLLISSGLYEKLSSKGLLIAHREVESLNKEAYKTIEPVEVPFISYPYEWSFSQLRDAALLTIRIQKIAMKMGMSLKDASAYNIQFINGKPVLIDTLSFETYKEGLPWVAYRQFCQHFFAPLCLASYRDIRLLKLLSDYIDGIPLDMASNLLPRKTKLNFSIASHIHWHARAQVQHANKANSKHKEAKVSKTGLLGIIQNLESTIKKLAWKPGATEWGDYYNNTNYKNNSFEHKYRIVESFIDEIHPVNVWDLGANDGTFSSIASGKGIETVAFDIDPQAVNINYNKVKAEGMQHMLPLIMDLTNPSPGLGWANKERDSLSSRGPVDCIMALALIHHISISNNVPMEMISAYLAELGKHLIIEFVPKSDSKVQILLATREDIFPMYTIEDFERSFAQHFTLLRKEPIESSERTMYLFQCKN